MADETTGSPVRNVIKLLNKGIQRKINIENWEKQKRKRMKNSGQEHTTYKTESVAAKDPPDMASEKTLQVLTIT